MKRATKIWIAAAAIAGLGTLTAAGVAASDGDCGWHRAAGFGGGMHHGRHGGHGELPDVELDRMGLGR